MSKIFTDDIDKNPYTGKVEVSGKVRVIDAPHIRPFFDGTENYEQVRNITIGNVYSVVGKEGLGDVEDIFIIDDLNQVSRLCSFFFEEVPEIEKLKENPELETLEAEPGV